MRTRSTRTPAILAAWLLVAACSDGPTWTTASLSPPPPGRATGRVFPIVGSVVDPAGRPVAGAVVTYSESFDIFPGTPVVADAAGHYAFTLDPRWTRVELIANTEDGRWVSSLVAKALDPAADTVRVDFTLRPH